MARPRDAHSSPATAAPGAAAHRGSDTGSAEAAPIARGTGYATARDGVQIYYEVCGSGSAMVFVHGLGGNHAVWFQQVARFAASHTVVTLSQRGFAPSGGDQKRHDVELLAGDLEAVMDAAGVQRAAVIGQSMGGWTALGLALRSPARVEALVLADTPGGIDDEQIAAHMQMLTAAASSLPAAALPLGVHPALSAGFSRRRPDLAFLYQTLTTFGAPAQEAIVGQLAAARVPSGRLARLRVPTLFVVGSEDRLFPPFLIERACAHIAGAKMKIIEDAGHSPYFEQPDAWNAAVASFLDRR